MGVGGAVAAMSATVPTASLFAFDAFGTAVGLAVVSGALSLLVPTLGVLVGTLAALALAGWASIRYQNRSFRARAGGRARGAALGAVALTGILYLDPPGALAPVRGLLLGLGLVPLWVAERQSPRERAVEGPGP